MNLNLKPYFTSKKIVYTKRWQPGLLIKTMQHKGKKYVRIAFTNKIKYEGMWPVTDVLFDDVVSIRKLPTPFKKWLYRLFGKKAKSKLFIINRSKK